MNILFVAAAAFGLAAGGGLVYGLFVDPTLRVLVIFIAGGVVLGLPLFVLAIWAMRLANKSQGEQRVAHNYSYRMPPPQPAYPPMVGPGVTTLGQGQPTTGWPEWDVVDLPQQRVDEDAPMA